MGEEIVDAIKTLQSLPRGSHWFCPRDQDDQQGYCYDEDLTLEELASENEAERKRRKSQIEKLDRRRETVLTALQIFAFNDEPAKEYREWCQDGLRRLMQGCDVCVRIFHIARSELKEKLHADYDTEEVVAYMEMFDGINVERINAGLQLAERQLLHLPPERRKVGSLDPQGLYALFEGLNCEPFLRNEKLLSDHFDQPFDLVQTSKKLRLATYLPAFTYFIFSAVRIRREWAALSWNKAARPPSTKQFDTMIHKPLSLALSRVTVTSLDLEFLPRFWFGAQMVISRLDIETMKHSVRSIEPNIYRVALDHLHLKEVDPVTFGHLITTWTALIEKSSESFWDTMRSISPTTILEQFFKSPTLEQILSRSSDQEMPDLDRLFAWFYPFLSSVKANQPAACGAIFRELIERSTKDQYEGKTKSCCRRTALRVLQQTLDSMISASTPENYVGSAVVSDMMSLVTGSLEMILTQARGIKNADEMSEESAAALGIIKSAVALDCLPLIMDYRAIRYHKPCNRPAPKSSDAFWDCLTRQIGSTDQAVATQVLLGSNGLVGIEKFWPKFSARSPDDVKLFAGAFNAKSRQLAGFLERLSDCSSFILAGFFKTPELAESIVRTLFFSDNLVRQGAVDLLKAMSGLTGRVEAITYVAERAFFSFLSAFTKSIRGVSDKIIFTPMEGMIKLCEDVLNAMCDPSSGILRTRNLIEEDSRVVKELWAALWSVLTIIFKNMEDWGTQGHDKVGTMDFCRDTMQFADTLFDQYSVFMNAISDEYADEADKRDQARKLLQRPKNAMDDMVKWLRLKDEFLAEKSVGLVSSLFARLSKSKVDVSETALDYIEEVTLKKVRTNLSKAQLVQLSDALERYSDRRAAQIVVAERKKEAKQTSLNAWATLGAGSGRSKADAIDLDSDVEAAHRKIIAGATQGAEKFKKLQEQKKLQERKLAVTKKASEPRRNVLDSAEFMRKRKADEEEAKRKRMEAIAKARGGVAGPGSALNSMGNAAKDHSARGEGVMVDSDEESEDSSDDDQDDLDLELFGRPNKSSKPVNGISELSAAKLLPRGPVKVRRIQRSAKDMRARLAPDLSKLHQEILSWNYFSTGYYPPNTRAEMYKAVPKEINDPGLYKSIFQPLLVLETWRKISNDKDQDTQSRPYEVKIVSRASVDAFMEVNTSMPHSGSDQRLEVSEGDLVLLSNVKDPRQADGDTSCLGRIHKISRKKQHVEVLYRVMPGKKLISSMNGGATVRALKIESLITVEREYGALMGLQYYDLCDYIMKANPSRLLEYTAHQLRPISDTYQLNQAQAKAVKSALDNDAFTLIQGPPGSGKTKTIVATVGALLTDALKDRGQVIKRPGMPNGVPQGGSTMKKLLVCAPSNAAVDELVLRLKEGIKTLNGQEKKINVVRLGRSEKINQQVLEVTLEELIAARLNKAAGSSEKQRAETQKLMMEHKEVSQKLNEAHERRDSDEGKGSNASKIQDDIDALRRRKKELSLQIDQAKDKEGNTMRQNDLERKRVEQQILDEAHILCATLSASGHDRFQHLSLEFETVIVDEAAQCTELQALIPLKYGCAKCILVGDPKQLPPTTFMDAKLNFQYEQSLFVRMQNNQPKDVHLLDTQYRMHPEISAFPSQCFYDGRLLDGADMAKLRQKPWHKDPILGPYRFFDVEGQQTSQGSSLTNKMEIDAALRLVDKVMDAAPTYDFKGKIGIITPYKAQFNAMKRQFIEVHGRLIVDTIEFNTTDAFQGRECEIIIFSCVRASTGSIGFLNDYRRMNVGLTRAKSSLWVLGNTRSLVNGKDWKAMLEDAQKRNRISPANEITRSKPPSLAGNYRPLQTHVSKLNYDEDVSMDGESDGNPANMSRSSSVSSSNTRKMTNGMSKHSMKKEATDEMASMKDIEMKDASAEEYEPPTKIEVKDELKKVTKREVKAEQEAKPILKQEKALNFSQATGPGGGSAAPGYLVPRPKAPGQMPIKRKKQPANPLLENKRPKKH